MALPPGRLRLATRPSLTGSSLTLKTMGVPPLAAIAARAAFVFGAATMTAACRRTRSAARSGRRSYCPSA